MSIQIGSNSVFQQSKQPVNGLNELLRTRYQVNQTLSNEEQKQALLLKEQELRAEYKEKANKALDEVLGESLESPKLTQFGWAISSIGSDSGNELTKYHQSSNYLNRQISSLDSDKFKQTAIGEVQVRMAELNKFMVDSGLLDTLRGGNGWKTRLAVVLRKLPFVPDSFGDPIVKKLTEDVKASHSLSNMANALKNASTRLYNDNEYMLKEEQLSFDMELKLYQDFKFLTIIHEAALERLENGRSEMLKAGTWTDEHEKVYYSKILLPIVEQISAIYERLLVSYNLRHVRRSNREVNEHLIRDVKQISELTLPAMATALSNLVIAYQNKDTQKLSQQIRENHQVVMQAAIETSLENLNNINKMRDSRRESRQEMIRQAQILKDDMDRYRATEKEEYGKYVEEIRSFTNGNYNNSDQHEMELIKEIQSFSNKAILPDNSQQQNVQFGTQIPKESLPVYANTDASTNSISAILKG